MTGTRSLLLLRHGQAEKARPGQRDADRHLTPRGQTEADGVGAFLRERGVRVDRVLCSPATRTRETLERLDLDVPTEYVPLLYQAGPAEVLELAAAADVTTVLVVGHAPGLPDVVHDLADPTTAAPAAARAVADRFPPATLAWLTVPGDWYDPSAAVLAGVRLPEGRGGRYLD